MTTGERKRRRFPRGIRNVRALFCAPVEGLSVSVCEFVPHGRVDCHSVCGLKLRYPLLLPETEERGAVSDGVSLVFRTASGTEYGGSTTNNGINDSAATRGGGGGEVIGAGGGGRRVASSATRYCRPKQRKGEPYRMAAAGYSAPQAARNTAGRLQAIGSNKGAPRMGRRPCWCRWRGSNPHGLLAQRILSPPRLPIPTHRLARLL